MKRPPQIAEELEEEEVDKLLFLEVLVSKFSNFTTDFGIFVWLLTFFVVTFYLQERRRQDQTLRKMKRPQVAEELEEEEVDKLLFLEVLVFKFSNFTTDFVIFLWLLTFLWLLFVYRRGGGGRTRLFGR